MSCDVVNNSSPFGADSLLEDSWHKSGGEQGGGGSELDAVAEFDAQYGTGDASDAINPQQLAFGNANSQQGSQYNPAFNNGAIHGLDQTLSPEASAYGAYPTEFGGQSTGSPYFPSVEPTFHQPPHLRNSQFNHRRSVSEPPTGLPPQMQHLHQQQQPPAPPVVFHRENHFLGKPLGAKAVPLKSQYKSRPQRPNTQARKQKYVSEPYPHPDTRRAQTQPLRHMAPTSAPLHHLPPQYYQHQHQHSHPHPPPQRPQHMMMMMQEPHPYVSSRVCTPTPETMRVSTPLQQVIAPALSAPPTPAVLNMSTPQQMSSPSSIVSIPMTVEELRSMIFEAVQKAVREEERKREVVGENTSASVEGAMKSEEKDREEHHDRDQEQHQDQDQEQAVEQEEIAVPSLDLELPSAVEFEPSGEEFEPSAEFESII